MRTFSIVLTPWILALLCACTPGSKSIGETLASETDTDAAGSEPGTSTGTTIDNATDPASSTGTTDDGATTEQIVTTDDGATTVATFDSSGTTLDLTTTEIATTDDSSTGSESTTDSGGLDIACGEMTCFAPQEFCSAFVPGVQGAEIIYSCEPIPQRCEACDCLPNGSEPFCQCVQDIGFTVTCYGA